MPCLAIFLQRRKQMETCPNCNEKPDGTVAMTPVDVPSPTPPPIPPDQPVPNPKGEPIPPDQPVPNIK